MFKNLAAVCRVLAGKASAEPFGMPLQADDGERIVYNTLRYAIRCILNDREGETVGSLRPFRHQNALVVCAVYHKIAAILIEKKRSLFCMAGMELVIL